MTERVRYKYKVIKRLSRRSAIINGNSKYSRQYIRGSNVYAHGNSMGLMIFKNRSDAQEWANDFNCPNLYGDPVYNFIVIRVLPLGRGKTVDSICNDVSTDGLDQFYSEEGSPYGHRCPPDNTMAYPGVFVVD